MSDVILKAEDLKKYFKIKGRKVVKAVDGVSIEVERGKTLGLVGESGCGKSTLGRTLIRIYEPTEGKITLNGKDISGKSTKRFRQDLARSIQMIFQDPYACLSPRMTVSQLISEGCNLLWFDKASVFDILVDPFLDFFIDVGNIHANCKCQLFVIYHIKKFWN